MPPVLINGWHGAITRNRKETKMSIKVKVLGPVLLVVMATSVSTVMRASAETQPTGHFTSEVENTKLDVFVSPNGSHSVEFSQPGLTGFACHEITLGGSFSGKTVTNITIFPTYKGCLTTGNATGTVTVHTNGCNYVLTQPGKEAVKTSNTIAVVCPPGIPGIQITHATCTITIPPVEVGGVGYTTITEKAPGSSGEAKHAITLTFSSFTPITRHGGFCALLATKSTGTLGGSATVFGTDAATGAQVGITATGSVN
jgi:hypothetical protein